MGDNRIVDAPTTLVYFGKNIPKKTGIPSGGSEIQSRYRRASIGSCHDLCKNGRRRDSEAIQRSPISKCHHIVPIVAKNSPIQASDFEATMHGYPPFKEKNGKSPGKRISVSLPPSPRPSYKGKTMIDMRKEMGVSEVDKTKAVVLLPISQSPQNRVKRVASTGSGNNANKEHRRVPDPSLPPIQHHRSKPQPKKPIEVEAPEKTLHVIESTASYKNPQNGVHPSLPLKGSPNELKSSSHSKPLSQPEGTSSSHAQRKISPARLSSAMSLSEQVQAAGSVENVANPEEETESSPWNGRLFSSKDKDYSLERLHFRRGKTIETRQIKKTSPTGPTLGQGSVRDKNQNVKDLRKSFEGGEENNVSDSRITKIEHKKVVLHQQDVEGKKKVEDKVANPETENRNNLQNSRRLIGSEDNDCSPRKLLFRRGKVVETQCENTPPSKLTFRRGSVLEENQKGERDHRKSFKGREEDHTSDPKITKIKHENVVLQHRDHGRKKNVHKFEYNVIDETAKEGMVRALVSAFETLITHQDHKPSQVASAF